MAVLTLSMFMTIEFLGHKKSLLPFLAPRILAVARPRDRVADVFCGTGSVAAHLKSLGFSVVANDQLAWCSLFTRARLLNDSPPPFTRLLRAELGSNTRASPYERVLEHLNRLPSQNGFAYWNYSPAAEARCGTSRMYFTAANARRIDAIRCKIEEWSDFLEANERALLLHDLIEAINAVSNVAGTYGCYLKSWKRRALQPLRLEPAAFLGGNRTKRHEVHCGDAERLVSELDCQLVYADPPYTKRQYAAYYHVLETVALWDCPTLSGSTGLRPWKLQASDWCYKTRAPAALENLLARVRCQHFFLSYNDDGQIPHELLIDILRTFGRVRSHEVTNRRYKSSARNHRGNAVTERLYHVRMRG